MATLKTYTLICPDPDCAEQFEIDVDPKALADDGDLIECPGCQEEWEWDYDDETNTLELCADDDFDGDQIEDMPLSCEDSQDEEGDE